MKYCYPLNFLMYNNLCKKMAKDSVYGMNVDESKTQYISEINRQKVFFCREACQREFDQNPKKYGY